MTSRDSLGRRRRSPTPPCRRYEMSDFEWSIIQPLLANKPRGAPRADDRKVIHGMFWRIRTGSPWNEIPGRHGPYTTCYTRFVRWRKIGVWDRIIDAASKAYAGEIQMIESASVREHQHAANGKKGKNKAAPKPRSPSLGTQLTPDAWGARRVD